MKLKLMIQDREYCRALTEALARSDRDVFIDVEEAQSFTLLDERTFVLTDLPPDRFDRSVLERYSGNLIFLTDDCSLSLGVPSESGSDDRLTFMFKYSSISSILSDLSQYVFERSGAELKPGIMPMRIIAVCGDGTENVSSVARALSRQIMFHKGGRILVMSLDFINSYGSADEKDRSRFAKLMYFQDIGRKFSIDAFTYTDGYGISYLRLPTGINPLAFFEHEDLTGFIRLVGFRNFDTLILDIGTAYTQTNIYVLNHADNVLFLAEDESRIHVGEIMSRDSYANVVVLHLGNSGNDAELRIDDYVRKLFGIKETIEENEPKRDDTKVQQRDRSSFKHG